MKKKENTTKLSIYLVAIIMCAYSVNFLELGIYFPFLFVPFCLVLVLKRGFKIPFSFVILLSFSICYVSIMNIHNFFTFSNTIIHLLTPCVMFLVGYWFTSSDDETYERSLKLLILIITSSSFFGFLSLFLDLNSYNFVEQRTVISIWGYPISATGLNTYISYSLSLLYIVFVPNQTKMWYIKPLCFTLFSLSVYSIMMLGNRTGIVIAFVSFIVASLITEKLTTKKIIRFVVIGLLLLLLRLLYSSNFLNVKYAFEDSLLYRRFRDTDLLSDPRYEAWQAAFLGMFDNPNGGMLTLLPNVKYAHNMWLDAGYTAGLLPFIILLIFTIVAIIHLIKVIKSNVPLMLKNLITCLYVSFYLTFFVEPILEGWFTYFTLYCTVVGMTVAVVNKQKFKQI